MGLGGFHREHAAGVFVPGLAQAPLGDVRMQCQSNESLGNGSYTAHGPTPKRLRLSPEATLKDGYSYDDLDAPTPVPPGAHVPRVPAPAQAPANVHHSEEAKEPKQQQQAADIAASRIAEARPDAPLAPAEPAPDAPNVPAAEPPVPAEPAPDAPNVPAAEPPVPAETEQVMEPESTAHLRTAGEDETKAEPSGQSASQPNMYEDGSYWRTMFSKFHFLSIDIGKLQDGPLVQVCWKEGQS